MALVALVMRDSRVMDPTPRRESKVELMNQQNGSPESHTVELRGIHHSYGDQQKVIGGLDLAVAEGEFCTLLGPSGSGKTTLLRIIAGLVAPSSGQVLLGERDVTNVSIQKRNIGLVFQNYALFPHMSVAQNIEYPLTTRRIAREKRKRMLSDVLELVELGGMQTRLPGELSGGQQQRVAIARALVFEPTVLLLDEPLGALDRRLRQQLGLDLRRIQRETSITAIYVTHDQEEAFLLSDRVVVLNQGEIAQQGSPVELYEQPANHFVASFLGETNIFEASAISSDVPAGEVDVHTLGMNFTCASTRAFKAGEPLHVTTRPEDIAVSSPGVGSAGAGMNWIKVGDARLVDRVFLGSRFRLLLDFDGTQIIAEAPRNAKFGPLGTLVSVCIRKNAMVAVPRDN